MNHGENILKTQNYFTLKYLVTNFFSALSNTNYKVLNNTAQL